jgi:uncharacterized protein (DUF362 family)
MRTTTWGALVLALGLAGCGSTSPPTPQPPVPVPTAPARAGATPVPSATDGASAQAPDEAPPDGYTGASTNEAADPEPQKAVLVGGRVDGASLRTRHLERLAKDKWPVVVIQGGSAYELGKKICSAVVPKRPATEPVLLKPNICGFHALKRPKQPDGDNGIRGRTTDPEFTRGVIHCLRERGHERITIAEGCAIGHSMFVKVMALSGYTKLAQEEKVPLVGMNDDGVFDARGGKPGKPLAVTGMKDSHVPTLVLPKILVEHLEQGLFLSLPKLKAHRFSVLSAGIKGTQGVVMRSDKAPAHQQKWRMHKELHRYLRHAKQGNEDRAEYVKALEVFSERVIDVLEVTLPDAVLAEGAPIMAGDGFDLLVPMKESVAVGGTHPARVDKVAAQLLGLWDNAELAAELGGYGTSPLITIAAKRWGTDLSQVKVVGNGAKLLRAKRPVTFKSMAPFSIGVSQ